MELKEYQKSVLAAFSRWHEAVEAARIKSTEKIKAWRQNSPELDIPDELFNFPKHAWETLAKCGGIADSRVPYVDRTDEAGQPIPHVCFKVPTAGGKTFLAAAALRDLPEQTGLVLWITPTKAIYTQTKAALTNKEHPYRRMLDHGSGSRVKFMEKDYLLTAADLEHYLCIMLLSLPAANRNRNRDFLRMFRDSGRYPTLFPDPDDRKMNEQLLKEFPDLDRACDEGPVKHSLFNVFKMLRPVIVLDEAHKAYGSPDPQKNEDYVRAVNRLDPSLVIELSATPNSGISNLLVDVTGIDLKKEEMIKLPIQISSFVGTSEWQHTLEEAHDELVRLEAEARSFEMSKGIYIRPIAVVRVERTGKDQQEAGFVHANDVRKYLIQQLGVPENAVAIKSSEIDELSSREELLSKLSPTRWIITKAALMEGWDCSFAYVLVMLDNTRAQTAITQLVGRVMRQPYAQRTGRRLLDQCYVYCWNTAVKDAVTQVKNGLEREGMSGLGGEVHGSVQETQRISIERKQEYRGTDIFFPLVLHRDGETWAELDYQRHILPCIDWTAITAPTPRDSDGMAAHRETDTVDIGEDEAPTNYTTEELYVDKRVLLSWFARRLSDVIPNPWRAACVVGLMIEKLKAEGKTEEYIFDRRAFLNHELRMHIKKKAEKLAEAVFHEKLRNGDIRFDLEAGQPNLRIVESYEVPVPNELSLMARTDGRPIQMSLFEPVYTQQFDNNLERSFARYLDEHKALQWWHRVAVHQRDDYSLRGWKQQRFWPDFVAMAQESDGKLHFLIFDTKGGQLEGNPDTEYKKKLLESLERTFNCGAMSVRDGPAKGNFRLVFNEAEFPAMLAGISD